MKVHQFNSFSPYRLLLLLPSLVLCELLIPLNFNIHTSEHQKLVFGYFNSKLVPSKKSNHQKNPNKVVVGSWSGGLGAGFLVAMNHLGWCEKNNKIPVIHWSEKFSLYYNQNGFNGSKNVWEYYFEPVSDLRYEPGDHLSAEYALGNPSYHYMGLDDKTRQEINHLITKYVRIKPIVLKKIDTFFQNHMAGKETIGIHIRGTDKYNEIKPISTQQAIQEALKYADKDTQFFIASDEQKILDEMKLLLKGHTACMYNCYRSTNSIPIHFQSPNKAQAGEDVLVEIILLSRCKMLVHSLSNVSSIALYFNPTMPHASITAE